MTRFVGSVADVHCVALGMSVDQFGKIMSVNAIISFIIIAFCVFCVVKGFNKLHEMNKKEEEAKPAAPVAPPADIQLLTEIRDLLKKNS